MLALSNTMRNISRNYYKAVSLSVLVNTCTMNQHYHTAWGDRRLAHNQVGRNRFSSCQEQPQRRFKDESLSSSKHTNFFAKTPGSNHPP